MTITLDRHLDAMSYVDALRRDVRVGLSADPKTLPPKYFYDERGSALFDEITRLPEYYPTRTERAILAAHARDVAVATEAGTLVELGSGTSEKTRLLLDALRHRGSLRRFVPFDVDAGVLASAAEDVSHRYPELAVHAVVGDFERHLLLLPPADDRLVAFLGSTIGNLDPTARAQFLHTLHRALRPGEHLLLGTDLVKAPTRLVAAYDDSAGVTAAFNRNVLNVINRELHADFDANAFAHVACWNADHEWIEMRLRAHSAQFVAIPALNMTVTFEAGEDLRTEISAKFRPDGIRDELEDAGFRVQHLWTDPAGDFAVSLSVAA